MERVNEQFIERMGLILEADGAPRIAGRMLGFLLLEPGECSLDDIAEQLQVSKGSVSTNARLLETFGAIEKVTRPGDRRDYYRIADNMHVRIMERRLERMRQVRDLLADAEQTVIVDEPAVYERLRSFHMAHNYIIGKLEHDLRQIAVCRADTVESVET